MQDSESSLAVQQFLSLSTKSNTTLDAAELEGHLLLQNMGRREGGKNGVCLPCTHWYPRCKKVRSTKGHPSLALNGRRLNKRNGVKRLLLHSD